MNTEEIKKFIAEKVPEGYSLSKIQDMLKAENVNITFMELRLLASEIEEEVWKKEDAKKEAEEAKKNPPLPPPASQAPASPFPGENGQPPFPARPVEEAEEEVPMPRPPAMEEEAPSPARGETKVELSPIARPGAVASGSVRFGSGVTADWILSQDGRLGLDNPTGQPDQQDIQEFQVELRKLFER